jgi:hypothetical protein
MKVLKSSVIALKIAVAGTSIGVTLAVLKELVMPGEAGLVWTRLLVGCGAGMALVVAALVWRSWRDGTAVKDDRDRGYWLAGSSEDPARQPQQ